MSFDVRLPIGLLFMAVGALVAIWGAVGGPSAVKAGEANIDLIWGSVMVIFGVVMLALTRLHRRPPDA